MSCNGIDIWQASVSVMALNLTGPLAIPDSLLTEWQKVQTQIRLLLLEQSDLGPHFSLVCLSQYGT